LANGTASNEKVSTQQRQKLPERAKRAGHVAQVVECKALSSNSSTPSKTKQNAK
jgi:hypothetical protein